jgi:uncharacterized Zn finger protein
MFRSEKSTIGLTQDLITSTMELNAKNPVYRCVYCGILRHVNTITMELQQSRMNISKISLNIVLNVICILMNW